MSYGDATPITMLWAEWLGQTQEVQKCTTILHESWKHDDIAWWTATTPAGIYDHDGELLQYGHCNRCNSTLARHVNEQGEVK